MPPGLVVRFTRLRNRVKAPDGFAGTDIEGARITARPMAAVFLRARRNNHQIFIDCRRGAEFVLRFRELICNPGAQMNNAVVAELFFGLASLSVHREQSAITSRKQETRGVFPIAGPVRNATVFDRMGEMRIEGPN